MEPDEVEVYLQEPDIAWTDEVGLCEDVDFEELYRSE
jgi:hypothetical protein